jgi:hypothetical protein
MYVKGLQDSNLQNTFVQYKEALNLHHRSYQYSWSDTNVPNYYYFKEKLICQFYILYYKDIGEFQILYSQDICW